MTDRELMQIALDALERLYNSAIPVSCIEDVTKQSSNAIKALRDRLAQPEPEPVAWMHPEWLTYRKAPAEDVYYKEKWIPLYTAPPKREWVGLTDKEVVAAWAQSKGDVLSRLRPFAHAIEAKLKEKNS